MACLVASLSTGKGTWAHVNQVITNEKWDKIFLITNSFGKDNFKNTMNAELIILDDNQSLEQQKEIIKDNLKGKLTGTEVGLNLCKSNDPGHLVGYIVYHNGIEDRNKIKEGQHIDLPSNCK